MKKIIGTIALAILVASGANANQISFDMATYSGNPGDQIFVTIDYDFTDIAMFGGGLDIF